MLENNFFYLVGIKGVAMTALASALIDAGKTVAGSDVAEDFVTKKMLAELPITIDVGFDGPLPKETQVVIFSGANGGSQNPQVLAAKQRGLLVLSQARAQAALFNLKKSVAVCGVGGKSSVSAMLAYAWQNYQPQSYLVGVGEIAGLAKTGQYLANSPYFFAEADEYIEDPAHIDRDHLVPRFSFLKPFITICNSLRFDHPDAYRNLAHTKQIFLDFFRQIAAGGTLVYNGDDQNLVELAQILRAENRDLHLVSFGTAPTCDFRLLAYQTQLGQAQVTAQTPTDSALTFTLAIPGQFNALNALAAMAASQQLALAPAQFAPLLANYHSVSRRLQFIREQNGVLCYDDYAHHPDEIIATLAACKKWWPQKRLVVAFQSHTYSRTKQLFDAFVAAFADADEVVMIDIFPSAREAFDPSITSTMLCDAITAKFPGKKATNLGTLAKLKAYLSQLKAGAIFITVGAGDIYHVYD